VSKRVSHFLTSCLKISHHISVFFFFFVGGGGVLYEERVDTANLSVSDCQIYKLRFSVFCLLGLQVCIYLCRIYNIVE
jgi:hypothetical protein